MIRVRLDCLGVHFIFGIGTIRKNVIPVSELERLGIIRRLREERKTKKFSRTDITIEDISFRKL